MKFEWVEAMDRELKRADMWKPAEKILHHVHAKIVAQNKDVSVDVVVGNFNSSIT